MRVEIEGGKYTYQFHPDGRSEVLRYGEPWRDVVGDKFIYCMASEIEQLRQRVAELENECDEWEGNAGLLEQEYYKVSKDRDALKQQRDELLAAIEKACVNTHRGTLWLDIEEVDNLKSVIASVKEKA